MNIDFTPFFDKYQKLVVAADSVFDRIKKAYPDDVRCRTECSDCCHALFDLSLIEAIYLNHHFNRLFSGPKKESLTEKANKADRAVYKLKRNAFKAFRKGTSENDILDKMAHERIRCPLLNDQQLCDLYEHRPITCRLYGIPTSIGGKSHTCGISGFKEGKRYPTVKIDVIQNQLHVISQELVASLKTRYKKLEDILVPLSMALLTEYNEDYLGIGDQKNGKKEKRGKNAQKFSRSG